VKQGILKRLSARRPVVGLEDKVERKSEFTQSNGLEKEEAEEEGVKEVYEDR